MALDLYAKDESAGGSITLIVSPFDAILWGHLIWAVLERQPRLQAKKNQPGSWFLIASDGESVWCYSVDCVGRFRPREKLNFQD
ncbi:TPA: hypothetical protein ACWSPC_005052 [Escherichia coli]